MEDPIHRNNVSLNWAGWNTSPWRKSMEKSWNYGQSIEDVKNRLPILYAFHFMSYFIFLKTEYNSITFLLSWFNWILTFLGFEIVFSFFLRWYICSTMYSDSCHYQFTITYSLFIVPRDTETFSWNNCFNFQFNSVNSVERLNALVLEPHVNFRWG